MSLATALHELENIRAAIDSAIAGIEALGLAKRREPRDALDRCSGCKHVWRYHNQGRCNATGHCSCTAARRERGKGGRQ